MAYAAQYLVCSFLFDGSIILCRTVFVKENPFVIIAKKTLRFLAAARPWRDFISLNGYKSGAKSASENLDKFFLRLHFLHPVFPCRRMFYPALLGKWVLPPRLGVRGNDEDMRGPPLKRLPPRPLAKL